MKQDDIRQKLGERNRHNGNGERIPAKLPNQTLLGTPAYSSHIRKGIGRYYFVCYPHSSYRLSEDELKPFLDYAKRNVPDNAIVPEGEKVQKVAPKKVVDKDGD